MRLATILTAALISLCAFAAQAGTLHPALEARLDVLRDGENVSVIVHMTEQAPIAALNQQLKEQRTTLRERHRQVVEALKTASRSQTFLRDHLDDAKAAGLVEGYTAYWISNMIVVSGTKEEILDIAARPDVDYVEPNFTVSLIVPVEGVGGNSQRDLREDAPGARGIGVTPGLQAIRADEVWHVLGYNGQGRLIGSLDTGVDGTHPALANRWRGLHAPSSECWLDVLGTGTTFPVDNYGHGTHTTGTMTGVAPDDTVGVAWGAEWIAANAIDQGVGSAFDNDVIACFQWFADPDGNPNTNNDVPDVVQNSWRINEGFGSGYTDCDSRWWAAIDNCEASGVVCCFSAGNEGSGAQTIGSPADRATTPTNAFSIGAVDATNYGWPYPIAYFSSRGPTGCPVSPDLKIKPEVCGPGVDVYSSVPGGGYDGTWDGTSMSGPHVAGVVALMRQANPDLDVDTIKQILMDTARDEGTTGEDNTYGHGFIDAYEAVLSAVQGFGFVEGTVTNASYGNAPLQGVTVELLGTNWSWDTDATGAYSGAARESTYTIQASKAGFQTQSYSIDVISTQTTIQDFALVDIGGPEITNVSEPLTTTDNVGPYVISCTVTDPSTVAAVDLYYRYNGGGWLSTSMTPSGDTYTGNIPGAPSNTQVDYYVRAVDGGSLVSTSPDLAPAAHYSLFVTVDLYSYDAEDPNDPYWQLGVAGDNATTGIWVRVDPNGTYYGTINVQPEDDHTPAPGTKCFVTGNGAVGGGAGDADVDNGCTTLQTPVLDLSGVSFAFLRYWRWYGESGSAIDDQFVVEISDDGGANWTPVETVVSNENVWTEVTADVDALVDLTSQVTIRFVACDLNTQGLVEAAIDDFAIETYSPGIDTDVEAAVPVIPTTRLMKSRPNPYHPNGGEIAIRFALPTPQSADVRIYDVTGRVVRTLADGHFPAGEHNLTWDGRDETGREVSSGVYFYRLKTDDRTESRRLTLVR